MALWSNIAAVMDAAVARDRAEGRNPLDDASLTALASHVYSSVAYAGSGYNTRCGLNTPADAQVAAKLAAIAAGVEYDLSQYTPGELAAMYGL